MLRIRIITILIALAVLASGCGDSRAGKPAQDFTANDLEGNEISLSGYRGKVVLLDFWATWCAPCVAELPNVRRVYDEYKDDGFIVIGISLDKYRAVLEDFVQKEKIEWPQVFDAEAEFEVSLLYQVNLIPSMFLIDRDGILRYTNARGDDLEPCVKKLCSIPPKNE